MAIQTCLLYGANGYTGQLISALAASFNLQPILAGRNSAALQSLGEKLNLPWVAFDLEHKQTIQQHIKGIKVVIHAAGPFQRTAKNMIEACIAEKVHYIDITGEINVFELAKSYHQQAVETGVMLMPGAGFDVVPTDCMAAYLKSKLPDAQQLLLAFASKGGGLSHGTATTMIMGLGEGGAARKNGKIVKEPLGKIGKSITFGDETFFMMSIPWGDVSTAFTTTQIPNINTLTSVKKWIYNILKLQILFNPFLKLSMVRNYFQRRVNAMPAGPSTEKLKKSYSLIWGEVGNAAGEKRSASMRVANGYSLTAYSSLLIAKKIIEGNFKPGYQTPALAYGANLILEIEGSCWIKE
ncbi:MAG: saccharopine dehydrogenase family protein [Ferruginibacter sp.]